MIRIIARLNIFRRFRLPAILAVVAALIITACNPAKFRTEAAQVPTLIATLLGDPSTFNSALNESFYSTYVLGLVYDSLIIENPLTKKLEPALADSWKISSDGLRIEITLKEGLKWSDGKPMTADDIVFSYNSIYLNPEIPAPSKDSLKINERGDTPKVRKIDTRTVEFSIP